MNLFWINTAGGYLALDARINFFTNYYSISPGMFSYTSGRGANYLIAFTDSEGTPLSGGSNYRLSLPPNIPASIFWSVTLYCVHALRVRVDAEFLPQGMGFGRGELKLLRKLSCLPW